MTPPIEDIKVTPENAKDLTDEEIDIVVTEKQERLSANLGDSKETKEKTEKFPELDKENFRIDSSWWKEENWCIHWNEEGKSVRVKVHPSRQAFEYLEWNYKWEQLFRPEFALKETKKIKKNLPGSWTFYDDMINNKYKWDYQEFLKWENIQFVWWVFPHGEGFEGIDEKFWLRCEDGSFLCGEQNIYNHLERGHRDYFFSVRCLKD